MIEFELLYPLFGSPWNYYDAPLYKVNRHIDRWLAQGQADYEEQEYQRKKQEEEQAKYNI